MLDPRVRSNANLKLSSRSGNRKSNMLEHLDAVGSYLDRRALGEKYDVAIKQVAPEFGITESLLKKAVTRLASGIKVHRETQSSR